MSKVELIAITQPVSGGMRTPEDIVSYCARVSNPKNQNNFATGKNLLKYLVEHKHWSPLDMVNIVFEVETTRDVSRQIIRHWTIKPQEFCISGDSKITTITKSGKTRKIPIEKLYKRYNSKQYWNMSDNLVRVYDEDEKIFKSAKIKEVFCTGVKPVYEIELEDGKKLQSTKEHKFLTRNGFKRLENIDTDDFVAVNGVSIWQNPDWLEDMKQQSIMNGQGLSFIAEQAGVSYHTIRKWLKRFGLQYTKKEVAKFKPAWNKGLPKELQPMFGKHHSLETRFKQSESSRKGEESNLYKGGTTSWRGKVVHFCKKYHYDILQKQNFLCPLSGKKINLKNSSIDHIKPVYAFPELAFDINNLQVLSNEAHKEKSIKETLQSLKTIKYQKVKSIKFIGEKKTYDLEVDFSSHNYIANGIVVHNSQRYAKAYSFEFKEARLQDVKNRQNSFETDDEVLKEWWIKKQAEVVSKSQEVYEQALDLGLAKEVARSVLPEGMTMTRMFLNGSLRSWYHYCQVRMDKSTQKEHREVAEKIWSLLKKEFSFLEEI